MRYHENLALGFAALTLATAAAAGDYSYSDIVTKINTDRITTLEALLPELPVAMRSRFVLMHTSRSLQEATLAAPRVIMFGQHGALTCTFNGGADEAGSDSLECFQFLKRERRFDFRQIVFPTPANGLSAVQFSASGVSADGKVQCAMCHSTDLRPNWDEYSNWPGAYGEMDDELGTNRDAYLAFAQAAKTHPRYQALVIDTSDSGPYHREHASARRNLLFSDLLGRMNAYRGARLLEEHLAPWEVLGFAVQALKCPISDVQATQIKAAGKNFATDTDLNKVFSHLNIPSGDWTTRVPGDSTGSPSYEHHSGFSYLSEDIAMALITERADAGNAQLRQGLDKILAYYPTGRALEIDYFNTLNEVLPDPDYFGSNAQNVAYVCPELVSLFLGEYLH